MWSTDDDLFILNYNGIFVNNKQIQEIIRTNPFDLFCGNVKNCKLSINFFRNDKIYIEMRQEILVYSTQS